MLFRFALIQKNTDEIVKTIELISKSFGGINLEDISAPRCFEIERQLKEKVDIPVFHDDQHGTAIVASAAMLNALQRLQEKKIYDMTLVINGAGVCRNSNCKAVYNVGHRKYYNGRYQRNYL